MEEVVSLREVRVANESLYRWRPKGGSHQGNSHRRQFDNSRSTTFLTRAWGVVPTEQRTRRGSSWISRRLTASQRWTASSPTCHAPHECTASCIPRIQSGRSGWSDQRFRRSRCLPGKPKPQPTQSLPHHKPSPYLSQLKLLEQDTADARTIFSIVFSR